MIRRSLLPLVALCALATPTAAQGESEFRRIGTWIEPMPGSLVLAGSQQPPECVVDVFVHLAGGRAATIGVLGGKVRGGLGKALTARGAQDVRAVSPLAERGASQTAGLLEWLELDGLWLAERARLGEDPRTDALILEVLRRGGVVGAGARAAEAFLAIDREREQPFLPFVELRAGREARPPVPGGVQFAVDDDAALVVHTGRRVCGYGIGEVVAAVAGDEAGWPPLREELEVIDVFDPGDSPSYALDLLAWMRAGQDRFGPAFPAEEPAVPQIRKGTLILQGGGGVRDETWKAFIDAAGGERARFVCIPGAKRFDPGEEVSSYSARELRERGCENVTVLHAETPGDAHADAGLHALLDEADGVWIDGGRTYQFMDRYENNDISARIAQVLRKGGVVGGSSAGCQVAGEFLVRGDPRSNRVMVMPGYLRGMRLLPGVVLDAHFLQRDRDEPFRELVARYPQLLGIGVDENTAILVEGSTGRVLGENQVSFYDLRDGNGDDGVVRLRRTERYDLRARKSLR